jgi:hypothetical protein
MRVQRAKYLDWCSAQVADHFLALSPDEIYELAERAGREETASGSSLSASRGDELTSYRDTVERVTGVLAQQLDLPSFDEWVEMYRRDPAAIEARLLGFWKERL